MKRVEHKGRSWRLRSGERRLLLIFGDLVASFGAMYLALSLWGRLDYLGPTTEFVLTRAPWFLFVPLGWLLLLINLYDERRSLSLRDTFLGLLSAAGVGFVVYLLIYFKSDQGSLPRRGMLYFVLFAVGLTLIWRWIYIRVFSAPEFMRRVLIAGAGESGVSLLKVINDLWPPPFYVVGLVDDKPNKKNQEVEGAKVFGDSSKLLNLVEEEGISDIIVAIIGPMKGQMFQALLDAQQQGVEITRMPVAYEQLLGRVPIQHLESDWLLRSFVDEVHSSALYGFSKRLMDIFGAIIGLLLLGLMLPLVALAILIESGKPVFFLQNRMGKGGRDYKLIKFRTMRQDAEADGKDQWAKENDPRATKVGRILRKAHLDEFPQFWNVLAGDMSLVGPRPELPEIVAGLEKQIPFYRARLLVKPGITGWAQVKYYKGASAEGSAEKLEYDLYYIKHRSLWMDLWIILRTFGAVFGLKGE